MRSKIAAREKSAAARAEAAANQAVEYDAFRAHLAMTLVSDMFEHHPNCSFKDCRSAGRCLAYDKARGVCPMPLDADRAVTFAGMMAFHDAFLQDLFGWVPAAAGADGKIKG